MQAKVYSQVRAGQWDLDGTVELKDGKAVIPDSLPNMQYVIVKNPAGKVLTPDDGSAYIEALPAAMDGMYSKVELD